VSDVVGDVFSKETYKLVQYYYRIHAENDLLKAQIKGLREAVYITKRRRKRGKPLFIELRAQDENKAVFFSPAKIAAARELQAQQQ
jgi:hypothetical protein